MEGIFIYLFIFVASYPKHEILMADVAVATANGCLANLRMEAFRMTFMHVKNMKVNCWYQLQNKERIYNWNTFYLEALFLFFQGHLKSCIN